MNQNFTGTSPFTSNDLHSTIHATCNHIVEIQSTGKHFFDVTKEMMWWSNTSSSNSCSTSMQIYAIFCVDIQIHILKINILLTCLIYAVFISPCPGPWSHLSRGSTFPNSARPKVLSQACLVLFFPTMRVFLAVKLGPTIISHQQLTWKTFRNHQG